MRRHPADPLGVAFPGRMTFGQDRTELFRGYRPGDPLDFSFGDFPSACLDRSCGDCSSTPLPERLRVLRRDPGFPSTSVLSLLLPLAAAAPLAFDGDNPLVPSAS